MTPQPDIPDILQAKRRGFFEVDNDDFCGASYDDAYESIDAESHDEFIRNGGEEEE